MSMARKIQAAARNHTTYSVGLLQTKAYRALKQMTNESLAHFGVTSVQWAFLGILYGKDGLKPAEAARGVGVEAPFITQMTGELESKGLVESRPHPTDSRAKLICLTSRGTKFVAETERHLRAEMRPLVEGVSTADLAAYLLVLEAIVKNHGLKKA